MRTRIDLNFVILVRKLIYFKTMIAAHDFYENEYATFWISDDLLYFTYKEGVHIDEASAKRIVADRIRFQDERTFSVLCDIRGVASMDKEARDYLAQTGSILTRAVALVGTNAVSISMSTFYIRINRPTVPTALFSTLADAVHYLKTLQ